VIIRHDTDNNIDNTIDTTLISEEAADGESHHCVGDDVGSP